MPKLPPIVMECPECGEQYLISRDSYTPSEKATLYSDGFYSDEVNWRTPEVIGCITCELGFFTKDGKIVAEPDWDEYNEKWSHLKKAEPPTAGSLTLELRARKSMDIETEIALRKELWYAGIHFETGRILMTKNQKFKTFWEESLVRLEQILNTLSIENRLLKAECNRQLGEFEKCISILSNIDSKISNEIIKKAQEQDNLVFVISQP